MRWFTAIHDSTFALNNWTAVVLSGAKRRESITPFEHIFPTIFAHIHTHTCVIMRKHFIPTTVMRLIFLLSIRIRCAVGLAGRDSVKIPRPAIKCVRHVLPSLSRSRKSCYAYVTGRFDGIFVLHKWSKFYINLGESSYLSR